MGSFTTKPWYLDDPVEIYEVGRMMGFSNRMIDAAIHVATGEYQGKDGSVKFDPLESHYSRCFAARRKNI